MNIPNLSTTLHGELPFLIGCIGLIALAVLVQLFRSARSFLADLRTAERMGEI